MEDKIQYLVKKAKHGNVPIALLLRMAYLEGRKDAIAQVLEEVQEDDNV